MKRLTEEMVIARTKISDLSSIKRLNCWGSELTDVSLLRRMTNVEVLSLSINKINSLVDFQDCRNLQELYIRQNSIKDLNEVCYLQHLANLKNLWLGENPCASGEGYRLAVLRALPNLQKLDDVSVQPEEVTDAKRRGRILVHPDDVDEQESNRVGQEQYWKSTNGGSHSHRSTPEISPTRVESSRQPSFDPEDDQDYYELDESNERKTRYSPSGQESPPRRGDSDSRRNYSPDPDTGPVYYEDRRNANNYDGGEPARQSRQYDTRHYDRSPASSTNNTDDLGPPPESPTEVRVPRSVSNNSVKEYTNGDRYLPQSYQQSSNYRQNDAGSDGSNHSHSGYEQPHGRQRNDLRERGDRCERASCPANHRPPFHRRPVTRNSNILSAVLCLVKELDYPSLEVVEMAVRCRMDELED